MMLCEGVESFARLAFKILPRLPEEKESIPRPQVPGKGVNSFTKPKAIKVSMDYLERIKATWTTSFVLGYQFFR